MNLDGKVAFVTGGSGDIGGAIARAFAAAGADVALSYVGHLEGAKATANAIEAFGRRSLILQLDQRDIDAIERSPEQVVTGLGRVDVLVNNAGWNIGIPFPALDELTADIWNRVHETNLRGPYLLSRAFAPHLRAHGAGRIVNIASVGGLRPSSSSIAYSAQQGWVDSPDAMPGGRARTDDHRELRRAWAGRRDTHRRAAATVGRRRVHGSKQCSAAPRASTTSPTQVFTFCRAESVTGQVLVVDGGMPGAMH